MTNTLPGLTPQSGRRLLFSHTAFSWQGSWLVCSDQLGDLYLLDLTRNKSAQHYSYTPISKSFRFRIKCGSARSEVSGWVVCSCRFSLVYRAGQAVTALCCSITRPSEVLVGLTDHSVLCIDVGMCVCLLYPLSDLSPPPLSLSPDTGELVATLRGHAASVKSLSIHSSGRLLLAVSSRDCVLWDLDSFSRHRTLNGGQDVGIQDVS